MRSSAASARCWHATTSPRRAADRHDARSKRPAGSARSRRIRYVTREHLHVDRIATAWAIRRFVDRDASFIFVARTKDVRGMAEVPFDVPGAVLSHRGPRCTFEVLVETRDLKDPALTQMGLIIRGADLPHEDAIPPESTGVRAVFDALRDGDLSDVERLRIGGLFCDALFAYCEGSAALFSANATDPGRRG